MKHFLVLLTLTAIAATSFARNAQGPGTHGQASASSSAGSGQGRKYSLGDDYQPWPQAEMKQYAKPKFEPYGGRVTLEDSSPSSDEKGE